MNTTDARHKKKPQVIQESDFNICSCGYPRITDTNPCPFCGANDEHLESISEEIEIFKGLVLQPYGEFIEVYPEIKIDENDKVLVKDDIDNTDPYLSNKGHVRFRKNKDKWLIENIASNKAVFLRIEDSLPIKNGDIILLGKNRLYKILIK